MVTDKLVPNAVHEYIQSIQSQIMETPSRILVRMHYKLVRIRTRTLLLLVKTWTPASNLCLVDKLVSSKS